MLFSTPTSDVISVSALNRLARDILESGIPPVWIGGEISNLTLAASGHAYFSLKDANAQVRCVMFRQRVSLLPFRPANGMQVELRGVVTIYEARGDFQINIEMMRAAGLGRLFEAFERLKARLAEEGLFSADRKRAIPAFPGAIGIVTSPAAAALRDVVTTLRRRMPSIPLILYPTPVQGTEAGQQIAEAIRTAGRRQEVDVLIVCRGGGSIEDLWSFNEESVARAVAESPIPVISGVGHETDFTICDFVADLRAPTPTAAAEIASPASAQLQLRLDQARRSLEHSLERQLSDKSQRLDRLSHRLRHPGERLSQQKLQLEHLHQHMRQLMGARMEQTGWRLKLAANRMERHRPDLRQASGRLSRMEQTLARVTRQLLKNKTVALQQQAAAIEAINPEAVLQRGYAIVQKNNGMAVKSVDMLNQGERVTLTLARGSTEALIDHPAGLQPKLPF
jgi:exodeoxyribonuclease VII large subunit